MKPKIHIKLKHFMFFIDFLLVMAILISSILIYNQFKNFILKVEEDNYRKSLERTENFINMEIKKNIFDIELITNYLKENKTDIFTKIDFIESSYFINNDFKIENIFFPYEISHFITKMDLKNSEIFKFIKNQKPKEEESIISPLGFSIISGRQAISIITRVKNGFFINEIKIKKIFEFFDYASIYKNSLVFILEPNSKNIIARSNQELYPYYEFNKPGKPYIELGERNYRYDISNFPLLNVDIVILTPQDSYAVYYNLTKGFFFVMIIIVLLLVVIKSFISQRYNYTPFKKFLGTIKENPLKRVYLGNNFKEWEILESAYNENIKKIEDATKKIMQQYEEIQLQYEELEATYEELTNTNEELAQSNQNLVEMNNKLIESENNLKVSLKEKEILLKEVHHRVKNNLQLISSILNIQSMYLKNEREKDFLTKIKNRIKTISLIHEDMYAKENFSKIDFGLYTERLISYLVQNNNYNKKIKIEKDIEDISFELNNSIPFGLIINELVVNAMTHAFDKKDTGEIKIKLTKDKNIKLRIEDNGKGLNDIDYEKSEGFGFKLVSTLVTQLNGTLEIEKNNGTIINITFPENL